MPYIGQAPTQTAFVTDTFSGTGSQTAFTMSVAPAGTTNVLVVVSGVVQDPSTYSVVGTTLTFSGAPPSGTGNISARYLGIPASGITTTAYRTVTEFTATAGQTTFTPPSYTVGYIEVNRNGVLLGSADYTASNGTTVVLTTGATAGDLITIVSFYVSSFLNAIPTTGGTISGNLIVTGTETVSNITSPAATALTLKTNNGTTAITIDASQNVGIGTASPAAKLDVNASSGFQLNINDTTSTGNGNKDVYISALKSGVGYHNINYIGYVQKFLIGGSAAEAMRIDSAGNVFINSTSFPVVGIEKFGVNGGTTIAGAFVSTGTTNPSTFIANNSNGTVTLVRFASGSSGNTVGNITANGTNTTYGTSSDYRLKEDIAPMQNALNLVQQLKPVTYKWKTDGSNGQGFIAHELQAVVPDCVVGKKDEVDEEGNPIYQGIDTSYLVATLTAAIQELNAKVDAQAAEIVLLKAGK